MKLTENQRIFLNIIASYSRSLLVLICGLLSGRWVLAALGEVNYGLFGLIGGLMTIVTFLDSTIAISVARFYAVSVGISKRNPVKGLSRCRKFFTTALSLHVSLATLLTLIGYPIGEYVIENYLTIPSKLISDCVKVWQFSCLTCFISMITVPYKAFFTAKQLIAEVTFYKVASVLLMAIFSYYMVTHPSSWLVPYAMITCFSNVVPRLLITLRAKLTFPECRIIYHYLFNKLYMKALFSFSFWNSLSLFSGVVKTQGLAILINKYFGASANSAVTLSGRVKTHVASLSHSLLSAFTPAITNAYGAGEYEKMRSLAFLACKSSILLFLVFMLPVFWELSYVMELWLQKVPQYTVGLCKCILIQWAFDKVTIGHRLAISANGKIALYHTLMAPVVVLALPISWIMIKISNDFYSVGYALIICSILQSAGRVLFAKYLVNMSIRYWTFHIFLPIVILWILTSGAAFIPQLFMQPSFVRLLLTVVLAEVVFLPLVWFIILNNIERKFIITRLRDIQKKITGRIRYR